MKKIAIFAIIFCLVLSLQAQNLNTCLRACQFAKNGVENKSLQTFCRNTRLIPHPLIRKACWAASLGSQVNCNGFCYNYFS